MKWSFSEIIEAFQQREEWIQLLGLSLHGIEREVLRVDAEGKISQTPHPKSLGAALTHPYITTDFSEAQLELVTPTFDAESDTLSFLHTLHQFIYNHLADEYLWPCSSPCLLPQDDHIPIARYGSSSKGRYKELYRTGLVQRYGAKMQTLSGIHYNFSFHPEVWKGLRKVFPSEENEQQWISAIYLKVARNFLRMGWLNTYLFGATPVVHGSYFSEPPHTLKRMKDDSYWGEYATSLRMSSLGYFGKVQQQHSVSLNHLNEYVHDLKYATNTPHPLYSQHINSADGSPLQLNGNILQDVSEHYARIRPKPLASENQSTLESLQHSGIHYLEVRSVDIHPFQPDGVRLDQLYFLHTFLIYCLFKESPPLEETELKLVRHNQNLVALQGRDPNLQLATKQGTCLFSTKARSILDEMQGVAELLDKAYHSHVYEAGLAHQRHKVLDPQSTPSAKVLTAIQEEEGGYLGFGMRWAQAHKEAFSQDPLDSKHLKNYNDLATRSWKSA